MMGQRGVVRGGIDYLLRSATGPAKISEYSSTAADNTDIGGINIAEGMAPSDVNNAMREQMSQLKEFLDGSSGDTITTAKIVATTATILSGASVTGTATFNSAVVMSSTLSVANTATMGVITGSTISGAANTLTVDGTDVVGFKNIPQNSQSAAYTLVLADAGKHIFHPVGDNNARTFTIPANSSVAYPIGTAITFINMAVADVTIAITTDTLTLSDAGTTGSRTLAQYGSATCIKITSTEWLISGSGLT
jgi:hypothetical protein